MKMITLLVLAVGLIGGSSGFLIKVPIAPSAVYSIGPGGRVHLQKLILTLFENVCDDSTNPMIVRLAEEFRVNFTEAYSNPEIITNIRNIISNNSLLPKGEIFTEYNPDHLNELKTIYEALYFAKDFDSFFKAAAWARQNVNCGLFVDAIYLAILNRRETERLYVPAPYELLPNYFIQKDVVIKASSLLAGNLDDSLDNVREEGNSYIIDANYTTSFVDNESEEKMAYFREDIALNSYYFLQKLKRAPWFNTPLDMTSNYGEYLYHTMKQLSARYSLERYSNGLSDIDNFNWNSYEATIYDPMLIYSTGNEFCKRSSSGTSDSITFLNNIESSLNTVVSKMVQSGFTKTQMLNNLMEILVTGNKSYENVARKMFGSDVTCSKSNPAVMEHYITSLRDPVFWVINKKIVSLVDDALKMIPAYSTEQLYFPGIQLLNIEVKKMTTQFEDFQFDVTEALKLSKTNITFQVKLSQPRISHKPFTVKLNVTSLLAQKGLVKLFLGPKTIPGDVVSKRNSFMLLDSFEYSFKTGPNVVTRSSQMMNIFTEDFKPFKVLHQQVMDAEFGLSDLPLTTGEAITGFPSRLMLPKGTPEGLPLQIFAIVAPFVKTSNIGFLTSKQAGFNSAILSPGYPFDLNVQNEQLFSLPNAVVKDFVLVNKADSKSKITSDPSSPSEYEYKKKDFDYTLKKSQYGKKEDFTDEKSSTMKTTDSVSGSKVTNSPILKMIGKMMNEDVDAKDNQLQTVSNEDVIKHETDKPIRPILRLVTPSKRMPTVYDYLLPAIYFDDTDETEKTYA